ncbi:thioesterase [Acrocarpospora phusangensis]|uniref:Thioesterase n=1 Tax=Acrocarpospora phusangensis TaxID=1070424 RepID=A0A919QA00_9ACTN|nr:thioesterase [Acrocarpospora phusangensis]GIH25274.1 thioesterase [Acrocarpospora phusangensis]
MSITATPGRWLLRPPPDDARLLLFALPYAGVGASSYRDWPSAIGPIAVCPLQPPGRENRLRERPHRNHADFAADLGATIARYADRPYALIGHCGAVPYALATIWNLHDSGVRPPARLIASSWGPPQRGLYGRLNFVDLNAFDPMAEVKALFAQMGRARVPDDLVELAAETLVVDLETQRGFRYADDRPLPCPVTVLGWRSDDVVPDDLVHDGWDEVAEVRHRTLPGRHLDYLRCPDVLRALLAEELSAPAHTASE